METVQHPGAWQALIRFAVRRWRLPLPWRRPQPVRAAGVTLEGTGGPDRESPYVTVYVAASLPEAHVVKGRLETEDIPVLLRYESGGTVFGLVGGLGSVEVQVPEPLAARARTLLDEEGSSNWPGG